MENQNIKSLQQQFLLKVSNLMFISNSKDMFKVFKESPKIYEKLGMKYLKISLFKSPSKDMLFKCLIIFIAKKDEVSAEFTPKKYLL